MAIQYCPQCATEVDGDQRFCRRCGTSIERVRHAIESPTGASGPPTGAGSTIEKLIGYRGTWMLLRGILTLLIAIPSFLFLASFFGLSGGVFGFLVLALFAVFIGLGIRDIKAVARGSSMPLAPQSAPSALRPVLASVPFDKTTPLLEASDLEQTTVPLRMADDRSDSTTTRCDLETHRSTAVDIAANTQPSSSNQNNHSDRIKQRR